MIEYRIGDVTAPYEHPAIVAHVCNDVGAFGRGVAAAITYRWPGVRGMYLAWANGRRPGFQPFELGAVDQVMAAPGVMVVNMVAQRGLPSRTNRRPLDLTALETCLQSVAHVARSDTMDREWTVVMPRIGTGYGGHHWGEVEPVVARTLHDIPVVVYDPPKETPQRARHTHRGP